MHDTIGAMRDEIERERAGFEDRLSEFTRDHRDEINHLKETASALRDQLEAADGNK